MNERWGEGVEREGKMLNIFLVNFRCFKQKLSVVVDSALKIPRSTFESRGGMEVGSWGKWMTTVVSPRSKIPRRDQQLPLCGVASASGPWLQVTQRLPELVVACLSHCPPHWYQGHPGKAAQWGLPLPPSALHVKPAHSANLCEGGRKRFVLERQSPRKQVLEAQGNWNHHRIISEFFLKYHVRCFLSFIPKHHKKTVR